MEYLCNFFNKPKFLEFGVQELMSLASIYGISAQQLFSPNEFFTEMTQIDYARYFNPLILQSPLIKIKLPSNEVAEQIARRAVCINRFTITLAQSHSIQTLIEILQQKLHQDPQILSWISTQQSFAFRFDTYKTTLSQLDKQNLILKFQNLPFSGIVSLKSPQRTFILTLSGQKIYFGVQTGRAKQKKSKFYNKYSLNKREYLGPTSTDVQLAFLMVNQGKVAKNSLVLDPFVGTGSILIAASHFGALCFGGDLDMRVLKGYKVGRSTTGRKADIFTNFSNYGLEIPQIIRCDNSKQTFRFCQTFSSIICDPPYGVRAQSRKAAKFGSKELVKTQPYQGVRVVRDLLNLAASVLQIGGRLVYLLPCDRREYNQNEIPTHPVLKLVGNSQNILTTQISRRLITMEKHRAFCENFEEKQANFYTEIRKKWFQFIVSLFFFRMT